MLYKGNTIYLRLLEPEDYEMTHLWRDNYKMQKMTCGPVRFISKEMEKNWAQSKSLNNISEVYLAICLVENDKMIGWISINDVDYRNQKCKCDGIVIGDKQHQDGMAAFEAGKLMLKYVFDELNMNMVRGACLREHVFSRANMEAKFFVLEGIERDAIFKGGKFHDVFHYALSREEYCQHIENGDFEETKIIKRFIKLMKEIKKEVTAA